ncbi:AAA family ATPase [Flavobacterium sp. TSSA_36]|uniref:AAA family ATPase n=1 Tax=Flavobacterium sp. TSSA_36 TaxID=3447669 RepID=UPI003F3586C7
MNTQTNKLQLHFDYYIKHNQPKENGWYPDLSKYIELLQKIRTSLLSESTFTSLSPEEQNAKVCEIFMSCSNSEINTIEEFLERYFFKQANGIGDVKQGVIWDTTDNPDKTTIKSNASSELIFNILTSQDELVADNFVRQLLKAGRETDAVRFRFLRTLFPDKFAAPDAPNKLDRLCNILKSKLDIDITGNNFDRHKNICILINTPDAALRQMFTWEIYYMLENEINIKKAIVYYGAPGTGKTFKSFETARQFIDLHRIKVSRSIDNNSHQIQTVQFHPSFSYEDFFEGIRPTIDGNLRLFNGSFKQFCKDSGTLEIRLYENKEFIENEQFRNLKYDFSQIKINELNDVQKEILGCKDENLAVGLTILDWIEPAFFIIDEINRAELSKVFGELMLSMEYRGYNGKIRTQYAHLCKDANDESAFYWENGKNWFFVPQNIFIIGTMNNIDRSVDAFDFALRRRFMWEEVHPNYYAISLLESKGWKSDECKLFSDSLWSLNQSIENDSILDKNYRIGQSYILELSKLNKDRFDTVTKAKEFIWNNFIYSLLEEYLRGLGDDKKAQEKISKFKNDFGV